MRADHLHEARSRLERLANRGSVFYRGSVGSSEVEFHRAVAEARSGDVESAVRRLEALLQDSPGEPFALAELAALTGERSYALAHFRQTSRLEQVRGHEQCAHRAAGCDGAAQRGVRPHEPYEEGI